MIIKLKVRKNLGTLYLGIWMTKTCFQNASMLLSNRTVCQNNNWNPQYSGFDSLDPRQDRKLCMRNPNQCGPPAVHILSVPQFSSELPVIIKNATSIETVVQLDAKLWNTVGPQAPYLTYKYLYKRRSVRRIGPRYQKRRPLTGLFQAM